MGKYVTLQEVKDFSRLTYQDLGYETESQFDSFLNELIVNVEGLIEKLCKVPSGFFQANGISISDETHDWNDRFIILNYRPIISVSSVKLNIAGYAQSPDWQTIDSKYYIVYNNEGMIKIVGKTPAIPEQSVKISYTAGYSETPEPIKYAVKQVCNRILHEILQRKISPIIRVDDWTVRMVESMAFTEEIKSLLAPYFQRLVAAG